MHILQFLYPLYPPALLVAVAVCFCVAVRTFAVLFLKLSAVVQSARDFLHLAVLRVVLVCNFVSYSDWLRAGQSTDRVPVLG